MWAHALNYMGLIFIFLSWAFHCGWITLIKVYCLMHNGSYRHSHINTARSLSCRLNLKWRPFSYIRTQCRAPARRCTFTSLFKRNSACSSDWNRCVIGQLVPVRKERRGGNKKSCIGCGNRSRRKSHTVNQKMWDGSTITENCSACAATEHTGGSMGGSYRWKQLNIV